MTTSSLVSKPHFRILDGLRGVAAIMVVAFHIFEVHTPNRFEQIINHGYLAVDFFFMLSGFVIGYAYDDRWAKMSIRNFFRLRLVRLQPMVVMGMVIGAICFYFQDSILWPEIHNVPVWKVFLIMLIGWFMIPVPTSMDIRGWHEMYPLNGPGWSLFFEYVVNILYAVWIRKFSKIALSILVFLSACFLIHLTMMGPNGDVIGGWSLDPAQLHIGLVRVFYPFFAGLLLFRIIKLGRIRHAFLLSSLLIIIVLSVPRIGGENDLWLNGLYESLVIIFVFPLIIYIGASGELGNGRLSKLSKFLGGISYPIYITHYPLIYIYWAWVHDNKINMKDAIPISIVVFLSSIIIAYTCLKLYDEPVRKWMNRKEMSKVQ